MSFEFEARFFRQLLDEVNVRPRRVVVVGCGAGVEVAHIARATGAPVVGLDLDLDASSRGAGVELVRADARRLPFRDGTFQALYCYHVLEHVPEPARAVAEARRVLDDRGAGYFGTPNKSRLIGYAGGRATAWQKVWWNMIDYGKRLTGHWSNEQGAHAGFTDRELQGLLRTAFPKVESVSLPYYLGKYPRIHRLWRAAFALGLASFLAPSVYLRGRCRSADEPRGRAGQ